MLAFAHVHVRSMLAFALIFSGLHVLAGALQPQIPSISGAYAPGNLRTPFVFTPHTRIVVTSPLLLDHARLFRADLQQVSGWTLAPITLTPSSGSAQPPANSVSLQLDAKQTTKFTYRSGARTGEGYAFAVSNRAYVISANEPIGVWWGTRTLLQQFLLARADAGAGAVAVPSGSGTDVPGWEVRGAMLDVGRHFFTTGFLTELCAYASFWKLNTLHLHASDNLWDPRFLYSNIESEWRKLYTGFRFRPSPHSPISGLVPPSALNETWPRTSFLTMQSSCASRGVQLVPEIDTPGHSLVFSKWKPQLAMAGAPDNLNLSHPSTIPSLQSVWQEFLPWFSSSEVHIGADEYDRAYAGVYNAFINSMASFISLQTNGRKRIRVWGTGMPPANETISTDVTIQHWNFPDTQPVSLLAQGYSIINSEQAFLYTDGKTSYGGTQFPQSLDADLLWRTNWQPNIFTSSSPPETGNNTRADHPGLRGAVMALWNDWGNNATTPLEIFGQLSQSLAIMGERTWAGASSLSQSDFNAIFPLLSAAAPAQDLARRRGVASNTSQPVLQIHGDAKLGATHAKVNSLGPPWTLRFTVRPYARGGVLFAGPDSKLHLDALALEDVQTGVLYRLTPNISDPTAPRVQLPLNRPTRIKLQATSSGTWAALDGGAPVFYETLLDIWGEYMQRANMSFAAPAQVLGGGGFTGVISDVRLDAALT